MNALNLQALLVAGWCLKVAAIKWRGTVTPRFVFKELALALSCLFGRLEEKSLTTSSRLKLFEGASSESFLLQADDDKENKKACVRFTSNSTAAVANTVIT